ncbi:MAG: VWA domain-containing protein [Chromatiales bacterium]|nr:VWA domain-containing protein [Chromatiales bacterium]
MNIFPALAFERPLCLMLILVCIAAFLLIPRARRKHLTAYAEPQLLHWLLIAPGERKRFNPALIAGLLLIIAVSGPYIASESAKTQHPALDLALVLDISPSMQASDITPDRLQRARMKLRDLLARRAGDRATLIAFSAHAYRALPLTYDLPLLRSYIDALDDSLSRHRGSNIVQALELAAQALAASPQGGRAIILVSDGEASDPDEVTMAATRLAERGIPVFALGVGADNSAGAPVPTWNGLARNTDGTLHLSRLNRELLSALATRSGGRYADVRSDDADLDYLQAGLAELEASAQTLTPSSTGYHLYSWLLTAALTLMLWQGRRYRHSLPAFMLLTALITASSGMLAPASAVAAAPNLDAEKQAYRTLQEGHYHEAGERYENIGGYRGSMGAGAAAFRQSDWSQALTAFRRAAESAHGNEERALAWYNEATTLAHMGQLTAAMKRLDQTLALHPNHARAALNRDLLQRALKERAGTVNDASYEEPQLRNDADAVTSGDTSALTDTATGNDETGATDDASIITAQGLQKNSVAVTASSGEATPAAGLRSAGESATIPPGAVADDPRVVLRHRFMLMDAKRMLLPETAPW